jgi:hypothetical protein
MTMFLMVCSWVGIALTFAIGLGGLFATAKMADSQNIKLAGPLALGELRVALGSNFLVIATALALLGSAELFLVLAVMWSVATVVKLVSFAIDRPPLAQGVVGVLVDVVMGLLMYSGYLNASKLFLESVAPAT